MTDEDGEDVALRVQRALHAFSGVRFPPLGLAERLHGFVRGIRISGPEQVALELAAQKTTEAYINAVLTLMALSTCS